MPNTLWDEVRFWLTDATRSAIKEAEDLTRKGRVKMQILALNRQLESTLADLGGVTYQLIKQGRTASLARRADVLARVRKLDKLERELRRKQRELKRI